MQTIRIQRKRIKGFKLPPYTVCVNRGTKWGNPFKVLKNKLVWEIKTDIYALSEILFENTSASYGDKQDAIKDCLLCYEQYLKLIDEYHTIKLFLNGANLACFCPLDQPCHADILLKIANE